MFFFLSPQILSTFVRSQGGRTFVEWCGSSQELILIKTCSAFVCLRCCFLLSTMVTHQ